ncbi:fibronectin type III domain-containing protein [Enterococcus hirae]|uniref:fibronectin type III domain-containing protein n=1 Tax=Enterococcus hirae TaxID=1354 RepID=UPI0010945EBF|nr:fibronectin type III domain-containing protein [Enterococcus hirae]EMF0041105.1 fibronectin type III domain-containing protein [Enterococcus hirae]EMF0115360.1 fibronectin type III domain-containing protein [Enterococcus hirae]MCR1912028.1 fibronectin type III domain-containing protein [Enterococcus hirae]MDL4887760.1 fibronectin type III domain-containing protein [Enterococcus hirae]MDL4890798.1 fibronectin type III domain-containing protein [Enterococcus hirae]
MKIFKKLIRLMMIVFLFVKPVIVVAVDPSYAPSYQLAEEVIIKNGEFNDGLNHWIVSNPGSNNPALVTDESGNHYVMASNGENILQYVQLKPKTTYQFTYYVIGDPSFPAIVEFGTLNHGEGFISLKDERHYNDAWKQHEFSFTTPEGENTYIIRFASSGNGTAYFDNVQATALDLEAPTNPKNLKVNDVSSDSVSLSWEAATDNVGVMGYLVYRDNQLIQTVTGADLAYTDNGLTEDTTYTYEVRAVDQAGNVSVASNAVTARTKLASSSPPAVPLNLKVTSVTTDSVSLSWESATDSIDVIGYIIYRDNQLIQGVIGAEEVAYTDIGLMEDTMYTYQVRAVDQAGNISEMSNTVTARTKPTEEILPPAAPLNLRIDDVTTNSVSLSWEAAIDDVGVTGYHVYRDDQLIQTLSGTELSYIDTGLMEATTYTYKIRAVDQAGNLSEASSAVKARTKMTIEVSRPLPPTKLRSARVTEHEVALMWDAPNESKEIMSYQVYRNNVLVGEVAGETSLYTDKDLQENTKYSYVVKSKNKEGDLSEESNKIIVQTSKKHETVPPLEEEIEKESTEKPPVAKETETKNNGAINKGKEEAKVNKNTAKKVSKQLPATGNKVSPLLQLLGLTIVSVTILLSYRRQKKSHQAKQPGTNA